jgi:hypothetical protein
MSSALVSVPDPGDSDPAPDADSEPPKFRRQWTSDGLRYTEDGAS